MPSGYEKSPDYGGRPPGKWELHLWFAGFAVVLALMAWWVWKPAAECKPVDTGLVQQGPDGKAILSLKNIKPGDCVIVAP